MTPDSPQSDSLDRFHQLMTAALDGELLPVDEAEFHHLLAESPERQKEWNDHQTLREMTSHMKLRSPAPETWDRYWIGIYNRIERRAAWVLVSLGAIVLLTYAGFHAIEALLADVHLPWVIKIAAFALIVGGAILIVSVAREKWFTRKSDKYREIER